MNDKSKGISERLWPQMPVFKLPKWAKAKTDAQKVEGDIENTKTAVETAFCDVDVVLHKELYAHAYRDGFVGKKSGILRDAWPLRKHVQEHLTDNKSGSWWRCATLNVARRAECLQKY